MAFPNTLDNLTVPVAQGTDPLNAPDHPTAHNEERDAINALETKVGVDGSVDTTTIDYLLKNPSSIDPGHKHTAADIIGGTGGSGGGGVKLVIDTTQTVVTGDTAPHDVFTEVIPGGIIGTNDAIKFKLIGSAAAGSTLVEISYGGQAVFSHTIPGGGNWEVNGAIVGDGDTSAQKSSTVADWNTITETEYNTQTVDSTLDQDLVVTITLSNAGNTTTTEAIVVEAVKGVQGGTIIGLTAAQNLTPGTPVGISDFVSDSVATASVTSLSQAFGTSVSSFKLAQIATDKIVVAYIDGSTSDLMVRVGTFSRATMQFVFGSPIDVNTDDPVAYAIHKLDTDKFAVTYNTATNQDQVRLVGATVSTNTITLGTSVLLTTASANVTAEFLKAVQIATDRGIVAWAAGGSGNSGVIAYTFSGTVPTAGTEVSGDVNPGGSGICKSIQLVKIGTNKFAISSWSRATVGTIATNTITIGSGVTFASNSSTSGGLAVCWVLISPTTDVFVVGRKDTNNDLYCATVSGTIPTFGSPLTSVGDYQYYAKSATQLYKFDGISTIDISGNAISAGDTIFDNYTLNGTLVDMLDGTFWGIGFSGTNITYFVTGMSQNFIGFVQNTPTQGQNAQVLIRGIDSNQSGLIAGNKYLTSQGALTVNSAGNLTGVSATEILV